MRDVSAKMTKDLSNSDHKKSLENVNKDKVAEAGEKEGEAHKSQSTEIDNNQTKDKEKLLSKVDDNGDKNTAKQSSVTKRHKVKPLPLNSKCYDENNGGILDKKYDSVTSQNNSNKNISKDGINGTKPKQYPKSPANAHTTDSHAAQSEPAQDVVDAAAVYHRLLSDDSLPDDHMQSTSSKKGKQLKRKSTKKSSSSDDQGEHAAIKIVITNEEGVDKDSNPNERSHNNVTRSSQRSRDCATPGTSTSNKTSPSRDTSTPATSEDTTADNEDNQDDEHKVNNLLAQQQLYKERKSKPFQKLSKIKTGVFQAGIEGDTKRSIVRSIAILPDRRIILFDKNNKCLKLFDHRFDPLDRMSIGVKFCSITPLYADIIAATLPAAKRLQLFQIQLGTNKIHRERTFAEEAEFYSITHYEDKLFMLERKRKPTLTDPDEWEIKCMDLSSCDEELTSLRLFCPGHKDCTLHATAQGLYLTNRIENEVLQLAHDGTFLYRHKVELCLPVGVTADGLGNIYVCGGSVTSFIEVIKPDLRRSRVIFNKKSCDMVSMCFDAHDSSLYACDKIQGKIIRYRIDHEGSVGTVQGLMKSLLLNTAADV